MSDPSINQIRLEAWKTTIGVQQHFNDIEWKIRGLALTLLTAVLGASALAVKDGTNLNLRAFDLRLSAAILMVGLVVWLAFYFVDKIWYHRLLIGSVRYGEALERLLAESMTETGLTKTISNNSPYEFKVFKKSIHSDQKLTAFYVVIAALLFLLVLGAQFATTPISAQPTRPVAGQHQEHQQVHHSWRPGSPWQSPPDSSLRNPGPATYGNG